MNNNGKIILAVVGGLLALCLCVGAVSLVSMWAAGGALAHTVIADVSQVEKVAKQIADYDVPQEWDEEFALHLIGVSMVSYELENNHGHAFLMQFPADSAKDRAEMERQFRNTLNKHANGGCKLDLETMRQTTTTVRGQEVNLNVSEGKNASGEPCRQIMGTFEGKEGPTLFAVVGDVEDWDQETIDRFMASIR